MINLSARVAFVSFFLLYPYLILLIQDDPTGLGHLALLAVIQVTPLLIALALRRFYFLMFVLLYHFLGYSLGKYNLVTYIYETHRLTPEAIEEVNQLILCSLLLIVAYFGSHFIIFRRTHQIGRGKPFVVDRRSMVYIGILSLALPMVKGFIPSGINSIFSASSIAAVIMVFCIECPSAPRALGYFRMATPIYVVYDYLKYQALGSAYLFFHVFLIMTLMKFSPRYFIALGLFSLVAIFAQPIKGAFRYHAVNTTTYLERVELIGELIRLRYVEGIDPIALIDHGENLLSTTGKRTNEYAEYIGDEFYREHPTEIAARGLHRMADDSLERVLAMTPRKVPFWDGETYRNLFFMFIPRVLWQDKPALDHWHKFGKRYGFLHDEDGSTSIAFSYFAEGYMNYGYKGLYGIALMVGFLIALMEKLSFMILGKPYQFTFAFLLLPFSSYAMGITELSQSLILHLGVLCLLRKRLLKLAVRDDYEH